jgi:hypothetical protein
LFYTTRKTGFIYGHIVSFETTTHNNKGWVQNEIPKVALLNTLYAIYGLATSDKDPDTFLTKALEFYNEMTPQGYNLLKKYYLIVRLL